MARHVARRSWIALVLAASFFKALFSSAVHVAIAALARDPRRPSAVLAIPIQLKTDLGVALLANLETLTPGTCALHVSEDRKILYLHALEGMAPEKLEEEIHMGFERYIQILEN